MRFAPAAIAALCLCLASSPAAQIQKDTGVVPVRVVNGHLLVLTDLVGLRYTNEASFEISFEYPDTLTLHPDQYGWLGLDPKDPAKGPEALIHILIEPGIKLSIPAKEIVPEKSKARVAFQDSMTKLYSSGFGERKLKGTIGIGLLKKYHVTLDLSEKQMVLAPPRAPGDRSPTTDLADVVISPFEYRNDQIQVGLNYADNRKGRMVIGGTEYDTFIDAATAKALEKPAGNVSPAWLTDSANGDRRLDLSRYMALRPAAINDDRNRDGVPDGRAPDADDPVIVTGVNLLEHFRVELDWSNQSIAFAQRKVPQYPQQDFDFFKAEVEGTSAAMRAYVEKYPHERLSHDAANRLVQWLVEKDNAADDVVLKALPWVIDTSLKGRQAESCFFYVQRFKTLPDRADLTVAIARKGLEYAREAFDPRVVYALHNGLGEQYLKKGDLNEAWKHFLSSAFMTPDDMMTNLNLARVYDRQGRVRRAYSRYKRVAAARSMGKEIDAEVAAAMDRLRPKLDKDDVLLADEKPAPRKPGG